MSLFQGSLASDDLALKACCNQFLFQFIELCNSHGGRSDKDSGFLAQAFKCTLVKGKLAGLSLGPADLDVNILLLGPVECVLAKRNVLV